MADFLFWWQHLPAHMDPVIFEIGGFRLQYYGLMYIVAFTFTYLLASYRIRREDRFDIDTEQLQGLMTAMILGLIIGARLGYVLFYNASYYLHHPLEIILPFEFSGGIRFTGITGMSYHGGLIGVVLATVIFVRKNRLDFFRMADLIVPCIPLGYTFGRLGNFINGELYGRVTTHPIGMYFPFAPGPGRRHPSQLYEALFRRRRALCCPVGAQRPDPHPGRHAGSLSHRIRAGKVLYRVCPPARCPPGIHLPLIFHGPTAMRGHDAGRRAAAGLS
jgi:phosphatidylglycerol:prolipoprotein diacylglycerol transferase